MLSPLKYVDTCGLYNFIEVPTHFFKNITTAVAYGDDLFPVWFVPIINKSPKLKEEFVELANRILGKSSLKRKKVYAVFLNNNRIYRLCENKVFPLKKLDDDLHDVAEAAQKVFLRLYDTTLQGTLVEKELGENIHEHYKKFRGINESQACPFCGLENYPDRIKKSRAQYDHYLKKSKYYFGSVNFENLIPMCNVCNEAPNKHMKDILFLDPECTERRQVFYPYSNSSGVSVTITNVVPGEAGDGGQWNVTVEPVEADENEKVETWKNVFNIEDRYAARVAEDAENWIVDFIYQAELPDQEEGVNSWRDALRAWAVSLSNINEHKVVRNGILKQAYFEYLHRDASDPEVISIKTMTQSDMFTARIIAVGQ